MRKIIVSIFVVLVLFALIQLNENKPFHIIRSLNLQNRLSMEAKSAVFKVNFLGFFPAGEAGLINKGIEVYQNKEVYHLSAQAETSKFISKFFNAKAEVHTYIDKDKLHSLKFMQTLIIPDKPKDEKEVLYDQKNNIMELRGIKRQILPDTQDPLSAIFYIQHQALELGKEFDININTNQKNYRLYAKVIKKEEYALGDKKLGIWVLEGDIRRRDKSPMHSSTMRLWLLDNPTKTPILIKTVTSVGLITARLINLE